MAEPGGAVSAYTYTAEVRSGERIITAASSEAECMAAVREYCSDRPSPMTIDITQDTGRGCRGWTVRSRDLSRGTR